jgi:uncharacterized protein with PIN domain
MTMSSKHSPKQFDQLRKEFHQEADKTLDQMFGQDGQNGLVTFNEREDRACQEGDRLTRWLLEEHLAGDASADPDEQVDCPLCGRPVSSASPKEVELEERKIKTRRGEINFERAARRCAHCRRIFFPTG